VGAFQANGSDLMSRPEEGDLVFRKRHQTIRRKPVQRSHRDPAGGGKPAGRSPYVFKYPSQTRDDCSETCKEGSLENKLSPIH